MNNKVHPARPRATASRDGRKVDADEKPASSRAPEARALNGLLKALLPGLLAVEDFTSELPLRQLKMCLALYDQPLSMSEISRKMGVSLSAMTQAADRLERAALVERLPMAPDRRIRLLTLTERGQQLMRSHERAHLERMATVLEQLSAAEIKVAFAALETMIEACRRAAR
jgi:DNA-binding MarR family transcriptional regulator